MPIVVNVTEENITTQVAGNYFNFKPGQRKNIRSPEIAQFIATERRSSGLAVLPDLMSDAENDGDVEVSEADMASRVSAAKAQEDEICRLALRNYIDEKRAIIKNNQVYLARDLARANYKHSPEAEMTDGEFEAMKLVAKYDRKGKDTAQERIDEIEKLKKQISST